MIWNVWMVESKPFSGKMFLMVYGSGSYFCCCCCSCSSLVNFNHSFLAVSYEGLILKGVPTKFGKKPIVIDDNRRNTYKQSQLSASVQELPTLTSFDGENQQLLPVSIGWNSIILTFYHIVLEIVAVSVVNPHMLPHSIFSGIIFIDFEHFLCHWILCRDLTDFQSNLIILIISCCGSTH